MPDRFRPATRRTAAAYDSAARRYRDWWAPIIRPAALRLVDEVAGHLDRLAAPAVVDIGTGTGVLALEVVRRWPAARVTGVDASAEILKLAREAADGAAPGRLTFAQGDALRLPLADGTADAAVSSFVIQLVASRSAALREAHRVVRRGGAVAILTWQTGGEPFRPDAEFDRVVEELGLEYPPPAPDVRSYASPRAAAAELRRTGFRQVEARRDWLEHRFTPEGYLDVVEHWMEDELFERLGIAERERLRATALRALRRLKPDELVWRRPLIVATGRRPDR